jgi:AcrR family transcriptional regulator
VELSRERILEVALDLIDRRGLDALNMRDLGALLGASTMSVYRHFRNKADLLDALVDSVIADLLPERVEPTWQGQLRTIGLRVRAAILAHPDLAPMMGMEFRRSAESLRTNAEIISRLMSSGLPEKETAAAYWAVAVYTNGYALLEARRIRPGAAPKGRVTRQQRLRRWTDMLEAAGDIPPADIPAAASVLSHPIDDDQFLFGLDCLIAGIEQRLADKARKPNR